MDRDRLFLICLYAVVFIGSVLSLLYIENLTINVPPYTIGRDGNTVSFDLNGFNLLDDWDVIRLYMNNETSIMYLHGKSGYYGYHSIESPMSEKVHVVVEIMYINGSKEIIEDGWY